MLFVLTTCGICALNGFFYKSYVKGVSLSAL